MIATPVLDLIKGRYRQIGMEVNKICPPYGIYILSSVLKDAGHEVIVADLIAKGTRDIKKEHLQDLESCSLVGIGATTLSWPTALDVIKQIRKIRKDVPIVLGGIHPTMFDRYILSSFPVQYIIRGEGEIAFPKLCRVLEEGGDLKDVPNLSWRTVNGGIIRNSIAPLITGEELGLFPLPDYNLLPPQTYQGLSIESSRGCAFDCSFCSTFYRRTWRSIPAKQFVDRLEIVMESLEKTKAKTIHITDDEFSLDSNRAAEIAKIIRQRGLNPKLVYDSRAKDILVDDFIENIAEFTHGALVGAECGYDEGLKKVGKGVTCKILEEAARKLCRLGISEKFEFSFILGLPWETKREVERTIRFATHLLSRYNVKILLQWYCQIPGSHLWQDFRQKQLVSEAMYDKYGFFKNLYLFRTGVNLMPTEIWEINDMVKQLSWLASLRYKQKMIFHAMPPQISEQFPRNILGDESMGLQSLQQLSHMLDSHN